MHHTNQHGVNTSDFYDGMVVRISTVGGKVTDHWVKIGLIVGHKLYISGEEGTSILAKQVVEIRK